MKTIALSLTAVAVGCALQSCNTVVTETLDPITGKPTSRTTTTTTDPALVTAGINAAVIVSDRKSGK